MKKILLAISLLIGSNQLIQPSWTRKDILKGLASGALFTLGSVPVMGFFGTTDLKKIDAIDSKLNTFISATETANLNQEKVIKTLISSATKTETSLFDNLGTMGTILSCTYTAYRFLHEGLHELSGFVQVMGFLNMMKNKTFGHQDHNELLQQEAEKQSRINSQQAGTYQRRNLVRPLRAMHQ